MLVLRDDNKQLFFRESDVLYFVKDGSGLRITMVNNTSLNINLPFLDALKLLNSCFLKIHEAIVVNVNYVKSFNDAFLGGLIMSNGEELSVLKESKDEFLRNFIIL